MVSHDITSRYIEGFSSRFGRAHLYLAYHAAFPLALTPDLLYRLWATFQRDVQGNYLEIPWVAVPELLLSPLCEEVGEELYEMKPAIRNALLRGLRADEKFGVERIYALSGFLSEYVQQNLYSDDLDVQDFAKSQQWTVMAYGQPQAAARDIALAFSRVVHNLAEPDHADSMEVMRLASLVDALADPLVEAGLDPLVIYARGMASFVRGDLDDALVHLEQILEEGKVQVAGVDIPIPDSVRDALEESQSPEGPDFSDQSLRGKSFRGQDLTRANFSGCDLRSADFTRASLVRANFKRAQMGLQRRWALGVVVSGGLLAGLAGLAMALAGWGLGWQFNTNALATAIAGGIAIAALLGFAIALFRREIGLKSLALALTTVGMTAIIGWVILTLFAVRSGFLAQVELPLMRLVGLVLAMGLGGILIGVGNRYHRRSLATLLKAAGIAALLGGLSAALVWWQQGLSLVAGVMLLILMLLLVVAGAMALILAGLAQWRWATATLAAITGLGLIAVFRWPSLSGGSGEDGWVVIAVGLGIVGLGLAAMVTLLLANLLIWTELETSFSTALWCHSVALASIGLLVPLVGFGDQHVFPAFRVTEDRLAIALTTLGLVGLSLYFSWPYLKGSSRFSTLKAFAIGIAASAGTRFFGANLADANFAQSSLKNADFRQAYLSQTRWNRVSNLDRAAGDRTYLLHLRIIQQLETDSDQRKIFDYLDLEGINLPRTNLTEASFIETNLNRANLNGADLSRAKLINTQLDGADLRGIRLTGAYLQNCIITSNTRLRGIECDFIYTRLPTPENPDPGRQPARQDRIFRPGELSDFLARHTGSTNLGQEEKIKKMA